MVCTITVLQHISDPDMEATIQEMDRVLAESGKVLSVENTTPMDDFRSREAYEAALSKIASGVEKVGAIQEGFEVMSIFYGER